MLTSQYPQTLEGKICTDQNLIPFPFPQRSVGILNNLPKFYIGIIKYKNYTLGSLGINILHRDH